MNTFNAVERTIFGIPGYFFFTGIAFVISVSFFIVLLDQKGCSLPVNVRTLLLSMIVAVASARLFGCLSGIYRDIGMGQDITWNGIKSTGIVFYGGLIGLLVAFTILSRYSKQDARILNILAVCIPLFHSIARIGCFFGGCCFGRESHGPLSINYTTKIFGDVVTAYRIPVQLIEAGFNLLLFMYLLHLIRDEDWTNKSILRRYLLLYTIGRFIIEFFRGDLIRGVIHGISFSQVISALIWIYLATVSKRQIRHEKEEESTI